MTPEQIKAAREVIGKATPPERLFRILAGGAYYKHHHLETNADFSFDYAARTGWPAALKEVERLTTDFKTVSESSDRWKARFDGLLRKLSDINDFMSREGYRECDIPACNCGWWHNPERSKRLDELRELRAELERLHSVCGEAYQLAGCIGAPVAALDNLSDAAHGKPLRHETFLPVSPEQCKEVSDLRAELERRDVPVIVQRKHLSIHSSRVATCTECRGVILTGTEKFCPNCGKRLEWK